MLFTQSSIHPESVKMRSNIAAAGLMHPQISHIKLMTMLQNINYFTVSNCPNQLTFLKHKHLTVTIKSKRAQHTENPAHCHAWLISLCRTVTLIRRRTRIVSMNCWSCACDRRCRRPTEKGTHRLPPHLNSSTIICSLFKLDEYNYNVRGSM